MKRILVTVFTAVLMFLQNSAKAELTLLEFSVQSPALVNGSVPVNRNSPTTVNTHFQFARTADASYYIVISLVYDVPGQAQMTISDQVLKEDDWADNLTWGGYISGVIPAGQTQGQFRLKFDIYSGPNASNHIGVRNSQTIYSISPTDTPVVPNPIGTPANYTKFIIPYGFDGIRYFNINGTVRVATNGNYRMDFQADGNLVLYNGSNPIWASGKLGSRNSSVIFYDTGGLRTYDISNVYWTASTNSGTSGPIWVLQDDGNFVGYTGYSRDAQGNPVPNGNAFAGTSTAGGKKSGRSGRLN